MTSPQITHTPAGSINDLLATARATVEAGLTARTTDATLDEIEASIARARQALDQLVAIYDSQVNYLDAGMQYMAAQLAGTGSGVRYSAARLGRN
jgi:hypothetical protein